MRFYRFIILMLLGFVLTIGNNLSAQADYLVEPLRLELKMPANKPILTTSLVVRNTGGEVIRLKAYASNWTLDSAGGLQVLEGSTPNGLADAIRYNPKEFEIPPGESQIVRLAISLPDAQEGEYRGMLFFEDEKTHAQALESPTGTNASIIIKQRLGVTTYVLKGTPHSELKINSFNIQPEQGKLKANIQFENAGQRHYRGLCSILLSRLDASGKSFPTQEIPVNDGVEIVVLPTMQRNVQQILLAGDKAAQLEPGQYRAELILKNQTESESRPLSTTIDFDWPQQVQDRN